MEEQFANFLSDKLLEFWTYDSHKNNLASSAISSCNKLNATLTMLTKQEISVLAQHSKDYCSARTSNSRNLESQTVVLAHTSKLIRSIATSKSDNEVEEAWKAGVPFKTRKDNEWCFSIWEERQSYRRETTKMLMPPIESLDKAGLDYWLSWFLFWKWRRKVNVFGEFPPNTLYHICCGMQHYLRCIGKPHINFFSDPDFSAF